MADKMTNEEKLVKAKAIAYDLISNMEFIQKKLEDANKQVAQLGQIVMKEREAKKVEPPKEPITNEEAPKKEEKDA